MRKFIIFVPLILLIVSGTMQAQNIEIKGKQFRKNNKDTFILAVNYLVNHMYNPSSPNNYIPSPEHSYGCDNNYECNSDSTCGNQLLKDFRHIRKMNFNTIRLMGCSPVFITSGGQSVFKQKVLSRSPIAESYVSLTSPFTDTTSVKFFAQIGKILHLADSAGLMVILHCGAKDTIHSAIPQFFNTYPVYLSALSKYISNNCSSRAKNALIAYDLYNEPRTGWTLAYWPFRFGSEHTKQSVCTNVNRWYDTLKTNDPDRLITMGVHGMHDVTEYDMAVMKLDFLSPHIYPEIRAYDTAGMFNAMINRIEGELYWLSQNCPMPWILGETGFTANDSLEYPDVNGTLEEQLAFAQQTLAAVIEHGGSGYSWWQYQNVHWADNKQDFLGLLNYANCTDSFELSEKPVTEAFREFNYGVTVSQSNQLPDNYYDPFRHQQYNPDESTYKKGLVKDMDGNIIKDAYISAHTEIKWFDVDSNEWRSVYPFHYTFTGINGDFKIIPIDDDSILSNPNDREIQIYQVYITAPGANRISIGKWDTVPTEVPDSLLYELKSFEFKYDGVLTKRHIEAAAPTLFSAWNNLTLGDSVIIDSTAFGDIKARNEVHLSSGFEAHAGNTGEIHIYNIETFAECSCYIDLMRRSNFPQIENTVNINETEFMIKKELEINFKLHKNNLIISASPNPSYGNFNIKIHSKQQDISNLHINIFNTSGNHIMKMMSNDLKFVVDLSNHPSGLYYIQVFNGKYSKVIKLINL